MIWFRNIQSANWSLNPIEAKGEEVGNNDFGGSKCKITDHTAITLRQNDTVIPVVKKEKKAREV